MRSQLHIAGFTSATLILALLAAYPPACLAGDAPTPRILILFEGSDTPPNAARGDARELGMLLGHFNAEILFEGLDAYKAGDISRFDYSFFIGYTKHCDPPARFLKDVYETEKPFVWMNTGMQRFCRDFDCERRFGFRFVVFDTASVFEAVRAGNRTYTKGEENLNIIEPVKGSGAEVLAVAISSARRKEAPYMIRNRNFIYVCDSPFASATETDRYIFFADKLHDILGQPHEEIHRALLRIEDVDLFESPDRLREIADVLSAKGVPFLVGLIPFYVDPQAGIRLSLSEKPEFVDALHYMVAHGATIVMHGVTHQYQGVTATDYEFWDGSMDRPIRMDSKEYVQKKIETGLEECWKNSIYPLLWETPHYTASQSDYPVFARYFTTAMEQRMVVDDINYSQYFPYIIERDLYGQRIIPENLGYIPMSDDPKEEEEGVRKLLAGAEAQLGVRDGFASAFIHPFIDIRRMEEYVDGVLELGYTFMDVKNEPAQARLKDRVVLSGSGSYDIELEDQYLRETWLRPNGDMDRREISPDRMRGPVHGSVDLPPGELYIAEPSEFRETEPTMLERLQRRAGALWTGLFESEEASAEARVAVVWDPGAKGAAASNQASFVSAFRSLSMQVDTLAADTIADPGTANLLVVPYSAVERLTNADYDRITDFVNEGGCLITDGKNALADELGFRFAPSTLPIERMRDRLYPEDAVVLAKPEIMTRFETERGDEVFCSDEKTGAPVAVGRGYGRGKVLFLGLRFDPLSTGGYSRFPYLLEYVRSFFRLQPILRRRNLEVYFDPGFRHNLSVEELVKRWVGAGVGVIHAAGWHQYPTYTYDYRLLIELCHANGILVYAWLDPPQVSQKFWNEHPEWREVNLRGEPVRPSWRYPMALTEPGCLRETKETYARFIGEYDWDGVDLAELYFEAGRGPRDPLLLTPMHPSAREEFRRKAGFDPAALLDSSSAMYWKTNPAAWGRYEEYRVDVLTRLHEEFLRMLDEIRIGKPYLDVIVTAMDNIGSPELRPNLGVDIRRIMELGARHRFTLQVEDPQSDWSKDPRRYTRLGQQYRSLAGAPCMVDLNILQFRSESTPTPFPTLIQTGIESYQLVHSAALGADRFTLYSESSIRPQDLRMMGYAAAARASFVRTPAGWRIDAPFPVSLELPGGISAVSTPGGERYTAVDGSVLLPAGSWELSAEQDAAAPFAAPPAAGRLLSISANMTKLSTSSRTVSFSYTSDTRCLAAFNHRPYTIILDGREVPFEAQEGYRRFGLMFPGGRHDVIAILETTVSYGIDMTSFWSSWLIVAFGVASGGALLALYAFVRVSRPRGPAA